MYIYVNIFTYIETHKHHLYNETNEHHIASQYLGQALLPPSTLDLDVSQLIKAG